MDKPDLPSAAGPDVHLVAIYPPDGCGVGADPDCTAPTNTTIKLRFDRFLNPATISRQAIQVYTNDPKLSPSIPFEVAYDPLERVVEYRLPPGYAFLPHTLYQIVLGVPEAADDFGVRAFDGAPLAEADVPLHGSFLTSGAAADFATEVSPPSCDQIVKQVFVGTCTGAECHTSGDSRALTADQHPLGGAPYGLWLDDTQNFALSAIDQIAHETELGDESGGIRQEKSARFGVRMALVDPHNPGGSYLLYKVLRNPQSFVPCTSDDPLSLCSEPADPTVTAHDLLPLPGGDFTPPQAELDRLREWFVRGEPMPRPNSEHAVGSVPLQRLRALSTFIASGADCTQ